MACSGAALVTFQFLLYPPLAARCAPFVMFARCAVLYAVIAAATPFLAPLDPRPLPLPLEGGGAAEGLEAASGVWGGDEEPALGRGGRSDGDGGASSPPAWLRMLLAAHYSASKCVASGCYTSIFLIINDSVAPELRGRVHGLSMSLSSLCKAGGPTLGAVLFAWSLSSGAGPPFDVAFSFLLTALAMLFVALAACRHLAPAAARARGYLGGSSATQQLSRSRGSQELVAAQAAQSGADGVTVGEGRTM